VSLDTIPVHSSEVAEVVALTKSIDDAVVHILSTLCGYQVSQEIVEDLSDIASASQYVRGVAEEAIRNAARRRKRAAPCAAAEDASPTPAANEVQ
jgi:hypothetical protein